MTLWELLAKVDSAQLTELDELYALAPWGPRQEDLRAGTLAALMVNGNPNRKKGAKMMAPADFFPSLAGPVAQKPRKTTKQLAMIAKAWTIAMGGKVIEGNAGK